MLNQYFLLHNMKLLIKVFSLAFEDSLINIINNNDNDNKCQNISP